MGIKNRIFSVVTVWTVKLYITLHTDIFCLFLDPTSHGCSLAEFLIMCRYLLFCACSVALPTKGNLPRLVKQAMKDAGSDKNIHLWCCLTQGQMDTLQNSHLVFVACWGTGKTLLIFTKARELNDCGENVLILVFLDGDTVTKGQKSLLILDLEEKLKDCEHITIKGVLYFDGEPMQDIDGNSLSTDEYDHIFVDEYFEDLQRLSGKSIREFKKMISGKQTVWVSLSNSYRKPDTAENVKDVLKAATGFFPDGFVIANLYHPLRVTESNFNVVKNLAMLESNRHIPNNVLLSSSSPPSNISEGNTLIKLEIQPLRTSLQNCSDIFNNYQTMIIIDKECATILAKSFDFTVDDCLAEIWDKQTILSAFPDDKILTLLDFLQSELKKMGIDSIFVTENSEEIKKWMAGKINQILISTPAYIKGFECEAILDFTTGEEPQIYSRASIQIVKAPPDNLRFISIECNDVFENQDFLGKLLCKMIFLY